MTKHYRQAVAVFSAALLTLTMAVTAFGSQLALPDEKRDGDSSITIHKYAVDTLENLTKYADGTELSDDYELYKNAQDEWVTLKDLEKLTGIEFEVTRVEDGTTEPAGAKTFTGTGAYSKTQATDNMGKIAFDNLPFGTYLVTEKPNGDVTKPVDPFLVSVPMTHPKGDAWMYDIHVYPKNVMEDYPEIDKNILTEEDTLSQSETVGVGDTVTWQIDVDIPSGIATARKYLVTDKLDSRLDYAGNLKVYYTAADKTVVTLTKGTDFTATEPTVGANGTLEVNFDQVTMRQKLAEAHNSKEAGAVKPTLTIQFDTKINESARTLENMGECIPNKAVLDFTNSGGKDYKPESPEPEVHNGGVRLYKVDPKGNTLKGAAFRIYATKEDALAGSNPLEHPARKEIWEEESLADGIVYFLGLEYGKYYVVEVQAPEGYNLLAEPVEVTVNNSSHLESTQIRVENKSGFTLPITGGTGTVIFTVAGGILVGGALVLLFLSKKKKSSN